MSGSKATLGAALLVSTFLTVPVAAQTVPARSSAAARPVENRNLIEEVVVTGARKRRESAQKTPEAITALSAAVLSRNNVRSTQDLGNLAPNLQISKTVSQGDEVTVYLRGFGAQTNDPAVDPHVPFYVDGIYQPALLGTIIDLFDVSTVEVLKGPQGTLFGKNAPVGAISITTDPPTGKFGGALEADYGSFDRADVRGKLNFPILQDSTGTSILAGKVTFVERDGGNYVYNEYHNKRDEGGDSARLGRLALLFKPNADFNWGLVSTIESSNTPQPGDRSVGYLGTVPGNIDTINQGGNPLAPGLLPNNVPTICFYYANFTCPRSTYDTNDQRFVSRNRGTVVDVASNMSYRLAPVTLTSVTGYYHNWDENNTAVSGTPFDNLNAYGDKTVAEQESEEFRVSSNKGGGADLNGLIDWVVGGYFQNYEYSQTNNLGIAVGLFGAPGALSNTINDYQAQHGHDQSQAVFAHVIFNLTDKWTGTFGTRESWDQKEHDYIPGSAPPPAPSQRYYDSPISFRNNSIEIGTAYQFDANKLGYVRYAQGYEAGGFVGYPAIPNGGSSFQPETVDTYEVGVKTEWLDHKLRVNLSFFYNEISNLQVESVQPNAQVGFIQVVDNAGSASVKGIEAEILGQPLPNLSTHLNLGYLEPKYDTYQSSVCSPTGQVADCSGVPFEYAPKITLRAGGDYYMPLYKGYSATFATDWDFKSKAYNGSPPQPASLQPGFATVDASLTFQDPSQRYALQVYGTNIFGQHYKSEETGSGGLTLVVIDGRPAEWGLKLTAKF